MQRSKLGKLRHYRRLSRSRSHSAGPVSVAYLNIVKNGELRYDDTQSTLASRLDQLHSDVSSMNFIPLSSTTEFSTDTDSISHHVQALIHRVNEHVFPRPAPPKGVYIYGSVGIGKSILMDLFFDLLNEENDQQQEICSGKYKRVHFHLFMLEVHARIHALKRIHPQHDVIRLVASELYEDAQVLCFDEFQVTDIADAMILKRLFDFLFQYGAVLVATSNRPPDDLYKGGINRSRFEPFIDTLKERCDIFHMDTQHDYRSDTTATGASYFVLSEEDATPRALQNIFKLNDGSKETLSVMFGRSLKVERANNTCAWFTFEKLCHQPLGAADYISLANRFPVLIVDKIPQLTARHYNEARRFVTLIDVCYELRSRLVIAADVPLESLFMEFDVALESADGDEDLMSLPTQGKGKAIESWISGEGGSSSSFSTTMIGSRNSNIEWSATGRVGVSLAQLSSTNDTSFSFRRATSRLAEMNGEKWA